MNPTPEIVDVNGRPIRLDSQLASGGEGAVYSIPNDNTLVAKVYHRPPSKQTVEKLELMIRLANPDLLSLAAWPKGLLYNARTRELAGFVMPRITNCHPIQCLYNPVQRLKSFPHAGWNFQIRAALNLAIAFEAIHKARCLVGDVNQSNIQVSTQALVKIIDCDSFQVQHNGKYFLCEVGVAHYIPPELQGKSLRGLIRTENHDQFGLAVLIYQLLFVGRHPYMGIYTGPGDPPYDQLIKEYRFSQGSNAHKWNMAPPPYTPTFSDISPGIGWLFQRAFEKGSDGGSRPRSWEWVTALQNLEKELIECADDPGHIFWKGSKSCVWCRLAANGGPEYYFGVSTKSDNFSVNEPKIQEIIKRLKACGPFEFPYDRNRFSSKKRPVPQPLPIGLKDHKATETILALTTSLCVFGMLLGAFNRGILVASLLGAIGFGIWLAFHISTSPWHLESRKRQNKRNRSKEHLKNIEEIWRKTDQRYRLEFSELNRALQTLINECRGLDDLYQEEFKKLSSNAEAVARTRHLRLHLISDADISKIGEGRKQILAANNIVTAADIESHRIQAISGFGNRLTTNLLQWKQQVLRQFRFDPTTAISPSERRSVIVRFRKKEHQIIDESLQKIAQLEALAPSFRMKFQKLSSEIQNALEEYEQAKANLEVLNKKIPE